jgi:transmembrane sensor
MTPTPETATVLTTPRRLADIPARYSEIHRSMHEQGASESQVPLAQRQAAEWFVRLRADDCTLTERQAFERWLAEDEGNRREYEAVRRLWDELDGLAPSFRETASAAAVRGKSPLRQAWAVAAMVVLVLGGLLFFLLHEPGVYRTAKGEQQSVQLADGTIIHLNSDTALQVADSARAVSLRHGEALFEVYSDPARPFHVNTGAGVVRVLGTRFNVCSHAEYVRVAVMEGRVEVQSPQGEKRLLSAGHATAWAVGGAFTVPVESFDQRTVLAWREGKMIFDATPLSDVAEEFNRHSTSPLRLGDSGLRDMTLSGTFRIANREEFPRLLERMLPITARQADDGAWVLHAAQKP